MSSEEWLLSVIWIARGETGLRSGPPWCCEAAHLLLEYRGKSRQFGAFWEGG